MRIGNRTFGGERPKIDPRNIGDDEAQVALDCELTSSTLRALMAPALEQDGISLDTKTIHFFQGEWFAFDEELSIIELADRLFWTGPSGPRQATLGQLQTGQSSAMGVPKPDVPTIGSATGTGDVGAVAFETFYVVSFVNQFFQEGDKSGPTQTVTVETGQSLTISGLGIVNQTDPANVEDSAISFQRIYRLSEGESKFVAEIPATQTTFTETIGDITLGEVFPSEDFAPPPSNLQQLHLMANGVALGIVPGERLVYVSEPFNANAWPYFFPTEGVPVTVSSYDNNAVILTDSYPEVAAINDPRNIVPTTLTYREPCQSARSVVQSEGGIQYASVNGLFYVGRGGGHRITKDHLDRKDWQKYVPSSMISLYRDRQYIGFHQGLKEGNAMVFDRRERDDLRQLSQQATAVFVKPGTDQAYVAFNGQILELEASEDRLEYVYRSKLYGNGSRFALISRRVISCEHVDRAYSATLIDQLPDIYAERAASLAARAASTSPLGFGGAINQFLIAGCPQFTPAGVTETLPVTLRTINGLAARGIPRIEVLEVQLDVYGDKELVHTEVITDDEQVRRLQYYSPRRRLYEYELRGKIDISQIDLAGSNSEMHSGT